MSNYFRTDISCWTKKTIHVLPSIEVSKTIRDIEIVCSFLWFELYIAINIIDKNKYEP